MASSSTPSSSITTLPKKHEVFLSFRGEDTRYGITSHLYDALCRKNIETFIDDDKLKRGDEISPALLGAIRGSKIAVVIFSEDYASSKWCLRELAEIIECKKMNKLIVMPVFYDVDPSDVRKQTRSFERSFANYEEIGRVGICSWFSWLLLVLSVCLSASVAAGSLCFLLLCLIICRFKKRREKKLQEEVQKWREALTEASNLSGWDSSVIRPDSKLVGEIVETVCRELRSIYIPSPSDFEGLIGIHKRIEHVKSLLCLDMKDVRKIIGIWGMGGVGKTTIARAVFKSISDQFDGACFTEVGKILEEKGGSDRLICDVLSKVLHEENPKLDTPIRPFIMEMFNQKKVFIVLDDVNDFLQSETLVECLRRCGLGSRIIITSRDKQVLCNFKVDDHEIYEEEGLDHDEALELFHKYANPTKDCMALLEDIVDYAKGNPLALKVLGSSLKGKSKSSWESALDSLQGTVNSKIFDVLKISYDGLEKKEQSLFLDIACFKDLYYHGQLKILDKYSLGVLIDKSLVIIDDIIERVEMHNLLQEMGREIVRRESPEIPGKRSRLWEQDDVIRILKNNTGTDAVEVIYLDMDGLEDEDIDLSPQVFDNMCNLRFLIFHSTFGSDKVHLSKGLNCLPNKLMVLHWPDYPLRALPSNFNPKQLVKLDLSRSKIEQFWEGTKHTPKFPKLKWLRLTWCYCLTKIPNLSDFPMLVEAGLGACSSLVDLTSPVRQVKHLRDFDLYGCSCLTRFPNLTYFPLLEKLDLSFCTSLVDFTSVQQLNNLQNLNLRYCINVTKFPLISGTALETLNLQTTVIEEVPSSIQSLTNLSELDLSGCTRLRRISTSICKLKSLSTLDLTECSQLETFPEILETMESLKTLNLSRSAIKELPPSIEHLNGLQKLSLCNCENLEIFPSSFCNLSSLEELTVCNCSKLDKLPENLGNLKSLKRLNVSGSAISQLPSSITRLENLKDLDCSRCSGLTRLPLLSGLHSLKKLRSKNCSLTEIPEDIGCLSSLKELELCGNMFESLPKSIRQLSKLEFLSLSHCNMLRSLPEFPEGLEAIPEFLVRRFERQEGRNKIATIWSRSSTRDYYLTNPHYCL